MEDMAKKRLLQEYAQTPNAQLREKIILEYLPLVRVVAGRMAMMVGSYVDFDDLVGYGVFGLMDAVDKFDLAKEIKFESYASLRIRGSILDQIRRMDWIPRTIRQRQKKIEAAMRQIEEEQGRAATDGEIQALLGIDEEEYYSWQSQLGQGGLLSLEEQMEKGMDSMAMTGSAFHSKTFEEPGEGLLREELLSTLRQAIDSLGEKEKLVVSLYYYEELTLKEISRVLELSESRISQIHSQAIKKMRPIMGEYMGLLAKA